jgi:hypothetical protein
LTSASEGALPSGAPGSDPLLKFPEPYPLLPKPLPEHPASRSALIAMMMHGNM